MAIRGAGPPKGPIQPRGPAKKERAHKAAQPPATSELEDSYSEHEETPAARPRPERPRTPAGGAAGKSRAILHQALERLDDEVKKRQAEIDRIRGLIASQGASEAAFLRHQKKLARLREDQRSSKKRAAQAHRAMSELERGLAEIDESMLGRIEAELEEIARQAQGDARSFESLALLMKVGGGETERRLKMKGAAKGDALSYAEAENPTTLLTDLAARPTDEGVDRPRPRGQRSRPSLGKTLEGQARLGRLSTGEKEELP